MAASDESRITGKSANARAAAEALVKQLVGGETISARFLFSEFFEFHRSSKICVSDQPQAERY
jgi:phage/plasmid-associated DNA primase